MRARMLAMGTRRRVAVLISAVLVGSILQASATSAAEKETERHVPTAEKPLSGHGVTPRPRLDDGAPRTPKARPSHAWAEPGRATVSLQPGTRSKAVRAGGLPITLVTPKTAQRTPTAKGRKASHTPLSGSATVRILDQQTARRAGVDGLLFSLQRQSGTEGDAVGVRVDYSAFAQAYGGAYASRLKLVRLPACAATRPADKKCSTATPVASHNDVTSKTLTATELTVPARGSAAPMLLAATAGDSSDQGDYKATQLSASSSWQTNLNAGDFSWSYGMPVPDVPGGLKPQVGLSYSSSGIDGRTSNSNNQSSWAGDGFDLWPGSIERSYKSCADDGVKNADGAKPGDLCWAYDNATLSFNGHSGELIATGSDSFRVKGDDGTKVERLYGKTGDIRDNGDNNQEYWRVTTTDGTQYYFGYNKLPGWSTGDETTDSTWTTPVFGDDKDDKCHKDTFADSWCRQAWRWNLDYAVDTHGNAIAYYYKKETNYYARNLKPADETVYDRGGYLDRIEYGLKSSAMYSAKPLAKVDFSSVERCLPETGVTCDASTIGDKSFYWYDTPWDLNCKAGADCYQASPSFWSRKRLASVTTEVRQSDGTYKPVDAWALDQRWGKSDIDYQLLLDSLQHTGKSASPDITLPKVTFAYDQRPNRLKADGDNTSPFIKERLSGVSDETGGSLAVDYSTAACDASSLPTPQTNTTRCFPVYFTKEGDKDPSLQWFNKYVVDSVVQTDRTRSSPETVTRYRYLDGAAWHYDDDDGLTKEKYKTWSTWRGYGHVRVQTGGQEPVGMKSQTDHYFLRGMDGDRAAPSGGTKSVTVPDDNGGTITDHSAVAGFEYKTEQFSGPGGTVLGKAVHTPWHHETAKRVRSWGTTTANLTGTASTRTWTSLDDGAGSKWRTTYQTSSFENTAGRTTQTDDFGDESTSADDQCTRTTYAENTADWILDKPSRVEAVAVKCAAAPDRSKDVLADIRTAYDGKDYGAAPTKGDATRTATLKSYDGTIATYIEAGATFDSYGRALTATDITANVTATEATNPVRKARTDGRTSTTAYSPATGFPSTSTSTSPPATTGDASTAQTATTTYDPVRGLPVTSVDPNGKRTDTTYDALGRALKVWRPNRSKANGDTPNYEFSYAIRDGKPVAVGTTTLFGAGRRTSYSLYDGFLRLRQVQAPGPDGGRLINDAFSDERGLTTKAFAPYYNTTAPSPDLLALDNALAVETQTWNTYDGLGRLTKSQQIAGNGDNGKVLSTTTTAYGGDRTTVTPPTGATPTTTVTDARGRTTELWQYHAATPTGTADKTLYEYNPAGKLTKLTDPAGNTWTYKYDQRGNQTVATDPDKGETDAYYTDRNQLDHTVDANDKKVTLVYDGLGRQTETHEGDASGTLLTKHVWDPSGFKGQLASVTRYIGGASGAAYTTTYSLYDTLYRPHRTTVTIPSAEGALAGSYQSNVQYNVDGTVQSSSYPAAGSLSAETVSPAYDDVLRVKSISGSGGSTYLTDAVYSYTGKPLLYTYQAAGAKKTDVYNAFEWGTQRLHNSSVNREDVPGTDKSATYSYDEAGNITAISDVSREGTDNQCFTYDYLGRLSDAWAQGTATCAPTPTASVLGGPAPYWQSYTYDLSGNRRTEAQHDAGGDGTKDINRTYTYPPVGSKRPHALSQVDTTSPNGVSQDTYTYDNAGNTATRTVSGDKQTLLWDAEGHLSQVTKPDGKGGTKTTSYVYDADGNRLVTHTDTDTTLHLGSTEVTLAKGSTTKKATRYYALGGGNQAIRTDDNKLSFLVGDHHGTSELSIDAADLSMQQRRTTPFGAPRGRAPANWPGDKGFVGGTEDSSTGFTHLGARDYDPSTGHFLSVDPVLNPSDPQQLNAYAYSNSSPVSYSDPSGQLPLAQDGTKCGSKGEDCDRPADGPPDRGTGNGRGNNNRNPYGPGYEVGKDGRPVVDGIRIPSRKELIALNPQLDPRHATYGQYLSAFAHSKCFPVGKQNKAFCDAARAAGLWGGEENDPWGIKATLHCITGRGDCKEALIQDTVTIITAAWGTLSKGLLARGASSAAVVEAEESAAISMLRRTCSFYPSTPVLLKNGKTRPIGKVKPGDKVAAADPRTGKRKGSRTVTAQLVHLDNDLVEVVISTDNDRTATLHATSNHPFWDETVHAWVPAGSLRPGHTLNTARDGHVKVVGVHERSGEADMYNLTVEQLHTYYVVAGGTPILVHNADGEKCVITLKYKNGWSADQIAAADAKVAALNAADRLVVSDAEAARGSTSAADLWRRAGNTIEEGQDIDHVIDLQLGGADDVSNLSPLDYSVNRSLGPQIDRQIKRLGLQIGDEVDSVRIIPRQ
ncbi:polymorphic toxin-type HINT domain-containing protein [Streptomyces sp. NPDC054794]